MSFLLIPTFLLLSAATIRAQRTIGFFEQDFSMDYAKYSILYRQVVNKPPHYDQFHSNEAATKGFRRIVKKEIYEAALFTSVLADSIIEEQEYDKQGMLVKQSRKCFQGGKTVSDSLSTLQYKTDSIIVTISAPVSGKMTKVVDRIYKIDARKRITELTATDKETRKRSVMRYEYDQQDLLAAGYQKEEQGEEKVLFRLSYREWYDNPVIRGGRYEGDEEAKYHPAYLLYKETVNTEPGKADIKYIVWHDSISRISSSFALSPALIYFLYDKICEEPVSRYCTERSGFYRWDRQGILTERDIHERLLHDPSLYTDHAARQYPRSPGRYYRSVKKTEWLPALALSGKRKPVIRQGLYDGIRYQYQYF